MKKKILAFLLTVLTILCLFPESTFAYGFTYEFSSEGGGPHCKSILMKNMDTGTIVYSLNTDEERPMASLTKIMSYIVVSEVIEDLNNTVITVPQSVVDTLEGTFSSNADILVGEELTVYQLLNLMMIPSGNDAALTLATYIDSLNITVGQLEEMHKRSQAGLSSENSSASSDSSPQDTSTEDTESSDADEDPNTVLSFVDMMNRKAKELGCEHTNFTNPHGLHHPDHYTTANDMMTMTLYAMRLPYFTEITGTTFYELKPTNLVSELRYRYSTNYMLYPNNEEGYYSPYVTGIKTGSHNEAGYCLASSAASDGYTYVTIAMGSPSVDANGNTINTRGDMLDTKELYEWAFNNLEIKTIAENGALMGDVELKYAWRKDRLQVVAGTNVSAVLPANVEGTSIIPILDLPESVATPVKKGDIIGSATLTYADQEIGTVQLVAAETVERSEMMMTLEKGKAVLSSKWFHLILIGLVVLLALYIILLIMYRKKRRKKKRVKRFRDM